MFALIGVATTTWTTGCTINRSTSLTCRVTEDCDSDRVCDRGFCVVGDRTDAGVDGSASLPPDASIDAAPIEQTFPVNVDCNGGRCIGGSNGNIKVAENMATADKLCTDHGFPRSLSFTISDTQPGGKFCRFNPTTMQFGCDPSCSSCNPMDSVTCSNP